MESDDQIISGTSNLLISLSPHHCFRFLISAQQFQKNKIKGNLKNNKRKRKGERLEKSRSLFNFKLEEHPSQMEAKLLEDDDTSDSVAGGASGCHGSHRAEERSAPARSISSARSRYSC
ncbi:hypothetical protein LWI28_013208 [Acer negundo]|uniref:Uncharacterized protein n=1 Tax=Acer negundo TaxID=4023 RepID=A0AAD5P1W1_ACENE|nr:hypothetical protein LWI28_013208 [Acer negundo]KAK4852829.1 hypothetical protein QYF36_027403 [Acer negundo]